MNKNACNFSRSMIGWFFLFDNLKMIPESLLGHEVHHGKRVHDGRFPHDKQEYDDKKAHDSKMVHDRTF